MPYDLDDSFAGKHSIVKELYIATADDNYVAARLCYLCGLNVDFFWLAVHCIEKYLKAALLLNGHPAKSYGHDIRKLYKAVHPLAPELLPDTLPKPEALDLDFWHVETAGDFIERLYRDGQADNRYQLFGYVRHPEDLFKLDEVVFCTRRLGQPLEAHFLGRKQGGAPDVSRRYWMARDRHQFTNLSARLEEIISGARGAELQHSLLNLNFSFAPPDYAHAPISMKWASQNPVLVRRLYDPLEAGPEHFHDSDELWAWVQDNIQLPKAVIDEINRERTKLKAKWQNPQTPNS